MPDHTAPDDRQQANSADQPERIVVKYTDDSQLRSVLLATTVLLCSRLLLSKQMMKRLGDALGALLDVDIRTQPDDSERQTARTESESDVTRQRDRSAAATDRPDARPRDERAATQAADGGQSSRDAPSDRQTTVGREDQRGEDDRPMSRLDEVFESDWQATTGTFVLVWGIAAGLYGGGDAVTTWYALVFGASETNPVVAAAASIHPILIVVVKLAILGALYRLSHSLATESTLSLDDQVALAVPLTLGVVGGYATVVNLQNLPGELTPYVLLTIVFIGVSGAATVMLYDGTPRVRRGELSQPASQTLAVGQDSREAPDEAEAGPADGRGQPTETQPAPPPDTGQRPHENRQPDSRPRNTLDTPSADSEPRAETGPKSVSSGDEQEPDREPKDGLDGLFSPHQEDRR